MSVPGAPCPPDVVDEAVLVVDEDAHSGISG